MIPGYNQKMRRVVFFLSFACLASGAEVTFHKNVRPILQKNCEGCHRPGEAAPFSLQTYKEARPWAKAIRQAVTIRKMPPWFADSAHGKFANDRRLNETDIATIQAWVDQGAPEGKPSDAPPPVVYSEDWKIGKPDLVIEIPVDYAVPASGVVDYVWMATDTKLAQDQWIEKVEVRPGARAVVHHALVFARAPGSSYRPDLTPGNAVARPEKPRTDDKPQNDRGGFAVGPGVATGIELIGDYVPNGDPWVAPAEQARFLKAGTHLLFQMHYTTNGKPVSDRTKVGIVFAKKTPKMRVINDAVTNASLRIPPGAPNHEVTAVAAFGHDTSISGFGPHMHVRGKAMRYELLRANGEVETLLSVPRYDFNWQIKYEPLKPVAVKAGDRIRVTAWYDNSPNNPSNPDPKSEVRWGDQSWSEMLFAFFDYIVPVGINPALVTSAPKPAVPSGGGQ